MISVTVPASTLDLTTEDQVRLGWTGAPVSSDGIPEAIAAASRLTALWCRREFCEQTYEEVMEASDRYKIVLSERPVTDVTSVENDGEPVTEFRTFEHEGILLKTDKIPWVGPVAFGGPLSQSPRFQDRWPSLTIVYTAGWISRAMDPVAYNLPADVEEAVIIIVRDMIKNDKEESTGDLMKTKVGNFDVEYGASDSMTGSGSGYWAQAIGDPAYLWIPLEARRILMSYRRLLV